MIQFTEVLGFSSVLPVIPFLGLSLGLNAFEVGLILSIFSICQLFASPITGKLSDRFGRKPLLLFSQTSTFIGFFLLGIANNVWILITARLVDGLLGSNMTVSQAYISDVTNPKDRTKIYGYSSAVFGAGLIFGPVIGGFLLSLFKELNFSAPFFFAAGISLLSIILVIIFLPESLSKKEGKLAFKVEDIFPVKEAKNFFKTKLTRGLILAFFIYNLGFFLFMNSSALFADKQIHVTAQEVAFYMAWIGVLRVVFQSILINPLLKKLSENKTLILGIFSMIFAMSFLIFSSTYWIVYLPYFFLAFGTGVARPILTSKLTNTVKKEEVGSILGVNNSLTSIGQIISPILGGMIINYLPSQTLPTISTLIFVLMIVLWRRLFVKSVNGEKI